jgi:hypothetical protein
MSILPLVCSQISSAVPNSWASGLSGFEYWSRMCELGISFSSRFATPIWDSGASDAASVGVRMISAFKARRTATFSGDIFSGSVMIVRYPVLFRRLQAY